MNKIFKFDLIIKLKKMIVSGSLLLLVVFSCVSTANAYELLGYSWPQPSTTFYVDIPGENGLWDDTFEGAMYEWSAATVFQFYIVQGTYSDPCDPSSFGYKNGVKFASTNCGDAFGSSTLAITIMWYTGSTMIEADIIFNSNLPWSVYSGPWSNSVNDFHRVAVHELGHALGLEHEDSGVSTIMGTYAGNITTLQQDDINGVQAIYGGGVIYYRDYDNDGYGDPSNSTNSTTQPYGYVTNKTDCNDYDSSIHPGATEIAGDGIDQDCNGVDLQTCTYSISPTSGNFTYGGGTGFVTVKTSSSSCAWTTSESLTWVALSPASGTGSQTITITATVNTGSTRSGSVTIADKTYTISQVGTNKIWYEDSDGDGYGNPSSSINLLTQPSGYSSDKTDCNDNDASIHPGATEIAGDGIDQDCDGVDKPLALNAITIESDLSFKLPDTIYKSPIGDVNLWVDFQFFGEQNGKFLWELADYGTTTSAGNPVTVPSDLSFSFDATYNSLSGFIYLEANFKFFGDQSGKLLWELDSYTVK